MTPKPYLTALGTTVAHTKQDPDLLTLASEKLQGPFQVGHTTRPRHNIQYVDSYQVDTAACLAHTGSMERSNQPRIEEAMRDGQFENLRGRGTPLDPTPDPHVLPEMQRANSPLKNNGLAPAWISERSAVLAAIGALHSKIQRAAIAYATALRNAKDRLAPEQIKADWQEQLSSLRADVGALSRRIELQNFNQPAAFLEIFKVRLEDDVAQALKN